VLADGIAEGQHFVEGNKHTALAALGTSLLINGYDGSATQAERAAWILVLRRGQALDEFAARVRAALIAQ
jgi:prophage maintenance system killer protein